MEARYNIYYAGQIIDGHDAVTVRKNLAKVFNADEATLNKLFSGKAQLLKRDCDKDTALKYKSAMQTAGALPILRELDTAPSDESVTAAQRIAALAAAAEPAATAAAADKAPTKAAKPTEDSGEINLAPSGTEVLRENERAAPVIRDVDTSGIEIDTNTQRLSPEPLPPPAAPDTSHLDMGEVGDTIPNLPSDEALLSPNTDGLDLAPDGTDFSDCAAPPAAAPDLDLSALNVAPSGSTLLEDQYRSKQTPEAPSTDHLSLDNQ
jgi:hypothetical protein